MATITRGISDALVEKLKKILDAYEAAHSKSEASLYRVSSSSIRIRIIDPRFKKCSIPDRHDYVWDFITKDLTDEEVQEISMLLPIAPSERKTTLINFEFEHPTPIPRLSKNTKEKRK